MRLASPIAVSIGLMALAACGSPVLPERLDPTQVPIVEIGFEGETDTFPYPGGMVPVLVRATVSDSAGQHARSWSADPATIKDLKASAVGTTASRSHARFAFAVGDRMLGVPASGATVSSPAVEITSAPWGGTLTVGPNLPPDGVWVEIRVVFDDTFEGRPARIDATYGFWVLP